MRSGLDFIPDTAKNVAYTAAAGNTANLPAGTTDVLVWCTSDAFVRVGKAAVATNDDCPIPAMTPVVIAIQEPNLADNRVSALQIAAGGTLYVQPIVSR